MVPHVLKKHLTNFNKVVKMFQPKDVLSILSRLWEATRGMGTGALLYLSVALWAIFLSPQKQALSAIAEPPSDHPPRTLRPSDVTIPSELAYLSDIREPIPASPPSADRTLASPLVIHIQEAHTNYEGQQHLAAVLDHLVKTNHLKLILVEGGEGNLSLAYLREYGPPDNRREVAGGYLRQGLISGEEYLDIVSDAPLLLWGVEDKKLYQRNLQAFLETEAAQGTAMAALTRIRQAAETLMPVVHSAELRQLDAQIRAYQDGTLGLAAYAEALTTRATVLGVAESSFPQTAQFLAVHRAESAIDLKQVPIEQRLVIERLRAELGEPAIAPLLAKANQVKAGTLEREVFYAELSHLASTAHVELAPFPNLARYIPYVTQRHRLNATTLAEELDRLAQDLRTRLASTSDSRALLSLLNQVDLMEKLVQLRLSPEEEQRLRGMDRATFLSQWPAILQQQAQQHGGTGAPSDETLAPLRAALPAFDRFYDAARARDEALINHTLAKLRETGEPIAALITGGFHAPRISRALQEQGVTVMIVTPKIGEDDTNEARYRAVLKFKLGKGSLEEMRRLAAPATPLRELHPAQPDGQ